MPVLSRTVLCGAIVACLSSTATVEAAVQLTRRGVEQYDGYRHGRSSVVMVGVLLILIVFTAIFVLFWYRSRRDEDSAPRHAWQNLEKQKDLHDEPFQTIELNEPSTKKKLSEPAPVVHSTKKNRSTDTWDKYLSMIKSPSRLNSTVGKMSTMNKN